MYDYYLGGKDNYDADREAARKVKAVFPSVQLAARANRAFMLRTTRYAAAEWGIFQFLDIGTGIPTEPNLHQVAQGITPSARVVYVDNDALVLAYARALLKGRLEGRTAHICADLREPDRLLDAPELRQTLDLSQPVAVSLVAVMHFLADNDDPCGVVKTLMNAVAPGSLLVMCHATADFRLKAFERVAAIYAAADIAFRPRSHQEFARFFDGLALLDPGVTTPHDWRPDVAPVVDGGRRQARLDVDVSCWAAVARKPRADDPEPVVT